jgi:diketogulonate reductase-like aldo/keto reductase
VLAWGFQRGYVIIPKAEEEYMQRDNLEALEIRLTEEEMKQIASLDKNRLIFKTQDDVEVENVFA